MFATPGAASLPCRAAARKSASRGGVVGAATLWDPPGQRKQSRLEELLMMPTMLWAFRSRGRAAQTVGDGVMEESTIPRNRTGI